MRRGTHAVLIGAQITEGGTWTGLLVGEDGAFLGFGHGAGILLIARKARKEGLEALPWRKTVDASGQMRGKTKQEPGALSSIPSPSPLIPTQCRTVCIVSLRFLKTAIGGVVP